MAGSRKNWSYVPLEGGPIRTSVRADPGGKCHRQMGENGPTMRSHPRAGQDQLPAEKPGKLAPIASDGGGAARSETVAKRVLARKPDDNPGHETPENTAQPSGQPLKLSSARASRKSAFKLLQHKRRSLEIGTLHPNLRVVGPLRNDLGNKGVD